ncbi:hypothetical protein H5410_027361 [Solanum commersonii]|uniref:Uncharacterized protein n=1 Tax=Solanum commersonii TaxID=4109 RepID=A0A9J5Z126_SOLCO|nr:hypothetical protein H5410_027361 [Solanum commersonii]
MCHFSNFELTPTFEEIASFTGFRMRLHHQKHVAPRGISINKFFQQLNICKVKSESLDKGFLGTMVFPRRGRKTNIPLAGVVNVFIEKKNYTIVQMILANIHRTLTVFQKRETFL